jgi:MFS family permease
MRLKKERQQAAKEQKIDPGASVATTMRLTTWESGFFGAMTGLTQQFLAPFALLKVFSANSFIVSLLTTLPNLVGSFFQLAAPKLLEMFHRPRRYMVIFLILQALTWPLLPLLKFVPGQGLKLLLLVVLVVLNSTFALMINPVWVSYKGELVPEKERSWFFGKRNAVNGIAVFLFTLIAGWLLGIFSHGGRLGTNEYLGFTVLFVLATIARLVSAWLVHKCRDIPAALPKVKFTLREFVRRAPSSEFGRFAIFTIVLRFAVYIALPFFAIYQLTVLKMDYISFTAVQVASLASSFISMWFWAWYAERRGNRRIISITSLLIGMVPLLWLLTKELHWLIAIELLSGFAWGGFNMATANYIFEATSKKSLAHATAYFNLFNNLFIFLGGLVGSGLLYLSGVFTGSTAQDAAIPFLIIFGVSGVLRLLVWLFYRRTVRELRFVEVRVGKGFFEFLTIHPTQGPVYSALESTAAEVREQFEFETKSEFELPAREGLIEGMGPREKDIYTKKFVERVTKKK